MSGGLFHISLMMYYLGVGQLDAAIDWDERGIEQRQPLATQAASALPLKPLRKHPAGPSWRG
jgi:hypothetical protein